MNNSSSEPSFWEKLLIWTIAILLTIAIIVAKIQGYIDFSLWWFLPLWIPIAFYVISHIIIIIFALKLRSNTKKQNMKKQDMKKQIKAICNDIVNLIQNTYESNVQEQANALYEKIKWIDDHELSIRTDIPDHSAKRFSFMLKNKQHKEVCWGIAHCRDVSSSQRKSAVDSLKSFEQDYSNLWF